LLKNSPKIKIIGRFEAKTGEKKRFCSQAAASMRRERRKKGAVEGYIPNRRP